MNARIILFFTLALAVFYTMPVQAQGLDVSRPTLQVEVGSYIGQDFTPVDPSAEVIVVDWIGKYIRAIYSYGIGVAGILAVAMVMVGGLVWLVSAGNSGMVGKAKEYIIAGVSGLLLALFSYLILFYINPDLVNLRSLRIQSIKKVEIEGVTDAQRGITSCCVCTYMGEQVAGTKTSCYGGVAQEACNTGLITDAGEEFSGSCEYNAVGCYQVESCSEYVPTGSVNINEALSCLRGRFSKNFTITSTTDGTHSGSCHRLGLAADIVWDGGGGNMDDSELAELRADAPGCGFSLVYDERTRPSDSPYWTGPHIHLAICNCSKSNYDKECAEGKK